MTSGGNNFKLCPPNSLIFVPPPEDFCDAFCVAEGAFGRPCYWSSTTWRRRFRIDRGPLRGSSSPLRHFEPARVKPNEATCSIQPKSAGWPAPLTASAFNRLGQCANSPGIAGPSYCYAELAVSSLAVAVTIASTLRLPAEGWPGWVTWLPLINLFCDSVVSHT